MTTTRIDLLRHGLPEGDNCFRGHADFPLTKIGFRQMLDATEKMKTPDIVVSSPLIRCLEFAKEYADRHSLHVEVAPGFMELNFGDWDGKPKQEVWEHSQQYLSKFWSHPWETTPPDGETLIDYDVRISRAWDTLLKMHKGKHILLVTHGGVIKQIMRQLLEMPKTETYLQRLNFPYASKIGVSVYHDDNGKLWPQIHWPT